MKSLLSGLITLGLLAYGANIAAPSPGPIPAYVVHAVKDEARPPADTLAFAGVKPGMTVAELFPGDGYYSRMLSDIVGPRGRVYGVENAGWKGAVKVDQAMAGERGRSNFTLQVQPFGHFVPPTKGDPVWIT